MKNVSDDVSKLQQRLVDIILNNKNIEVILNTKIFEHDNWYLGAGCISQTVWNYLTDREIDYGIGDYDLVYFDEDISKEAQDTMQEIVNEKLGGLGVNIEIVNEARVHLWYEEYFGEKIEQFKSCEEAIDSWPTTATAVGVRKNLSGEFYVYSTFGLLDIFKMILRPNKLKISKKIYMKKVVKCINKWPELKVVEY